MTSMYRVVAQGLRDGYEHEHAVRQLTQLFNCDAERVLPFLKGKDVVVKKALTQASAQQYRDVLARCGCRARVEPMPTPEEEAAAAALAAAMADPTRLPLSHERLRLVQPELFDPKAFPSEDSRLACLQAIGDHLDRGDNRAAVVLDPAVAVVAAYSGDLDCVALLKFDPGVAGAAGWQRGTRLLAVNRPLPLEKSLARDLAPGPANTGRLKNFHPLIADLLTDQSERVASRKAAIDESEWLRVLQLGKQAWQDKGVTPRDGRPVHSAQAVRPAYDPEARRKGRESASTSMAEFIKFVRLLAGTVVCAMLAIKGLLHVGAVPKDGPWVYLAWLAIAGLVGVAGWCGRTLYRWLGPQLR